MPRRLTIVTAAVVALVAMTARASTAETARTPLIWGASAFPRTGENEISAVQHLERSLGQQLRVIRRFELWNDQSTDSFDTWIRDTGHLMMLSVKPKRSNGQIVTWASIANATSGSQVFTDMVKWGQQLAAYSAPIYVALHHEPEVDFNAPWGTSNDFRAAFRKFVQVVRAQGATNVRFILITTTYAFSVKPTDRRHIDRWYPGDGYVDAVGGDPYNWNTCRGRAEGWVPLQKMIDKMRVWGAAHPLEELWLPEWGSAEDRTRPGRKAQWIKDAVALLASSPYAQFRGVVYFHNDDQASPSCDWWVDSSPTALAAFKAMGLDPAYRGSLRHSLATPPTADGRPSRGAPYDPN